VKAETHQEEVKDDKKEDSTQAQKSMPSSDKKADPLT